MFIMKVYVVYWIPTGSVDFDILAVFDNEDDAISMVNEYNRKCKPEYEFKYSEYELNKWV